MSHDAETCCVPRQLVCQLMSTKLPTVKQCHSKRSSVFTAKCHSQQSAVKKKQKKVKSTYTMLDRILRENANFKFQSIHGGLDLTYK